MILQHFSKIRAKVHLMNRFISILKRLYLTMCIMSTGFCYFSLLTSSRTNDHEIGVEVISIIAGLPLTAIMYHYNIFPFHSSKLPWLAIDPILSLFIGYLTWLYFVPYLCKWVKIICNRNES